MNTIRAFLVCLSLTALPWLVAGCQSQVKKDTDPVKVSRSGSSYEPTAEKTLPDRPSGNIVLRTGEEDVLVGEWPSRAPLMDMDEQNAPVRDVFQKLARVSRLNFVVADEVCGEVTASMKQVPWTRALEAVLHSKGLVAVREGNVVRILRLKDWQEEQATGRSPLSGRAPGARSGSSGPAIA